MEVSIRPVREDDAESIVQILNAIIEAGGHTVMAGPITVTDQVAFMNGLPSRSVFLAAVDDESGRIVGIQDVLPFAPPSDPTGHIAEVSTFVSLDRHRFGVGRVLMGATLAAARDHGFRKVLATIRADNRPAVAFYESQGFRVIGTAERHARVGADFVDEVLAEKWIA